METLFINNVSLKPTILFHRHNCTAAFLSRKRRNKVFCHISGNERTSNGVPSFATARSSAPSLAKNDTNKALMNVEGSVLLPNGKTQEEIAMQELIPCNGITTAFIDTRQEIGVVGFLKEKGFLITGATGFLAKVLVEKILRTEPDVGKIFLMIKAKNKEAAMERLHSEIIETELFECLRKIHGKSYESFMLSKLVPVVGNVRQDNLGMEAKLADVIAGEVDVIINSAANTTFDERYDVALDINTQGPCRLMTFAKRCKKLKLFLHVSTAYVNGQRQGRVLEKPFCMGETIARERFTFGSSLNSLPHLDIEAEVKLAKACQENAAAHEMKEMGLERARVHGWQDTYVFTKAMGEMLINNMRGEIPVVIIRPSVIESTLREPFPGWMEGNRMMDPIILYYGKGQLTGFLVDPKGVIDVVPADMVVNATLAAMAKHGAAEQPGINIYHIASSVTNPLVFQDLASVLFEHFEAYPYMDSKGKPIQVQRMKLFHSMDDFSSHVWTDTIRRSGRGAGLYSPEMLSRKLENIFKKSVEQIKYLANIYQPYTFYGGRFDNTNTQKLMENMSEEERKIFGFEVESIDWRDFISNIHIPGLRRHVMKGRGVGTKSRDEDSNAI